MKIIRTNEECQILANNTGIPFWKFRSFFDLPEAPERFRVAMQGAALKSLTRRVNCSPEGSWFIYPSYRAVRSNTSGKSLVRAEKKREYKIRLWEGGSLVSSERLPDVAEERRQKGGGVRGVVKTYTPASRKRFQKRLAMFTNKNLADALFVTLTYPAKYPKVEVAKKNLRAFTKRMRAKFPRSAICWRMEFQKRRAVHFHLLVLGVGFIPSEMIARWWYEVVGSGDEKHLLAGTEVRKVKSAKHASYYVSKYMSKSEDLEGRIPPGQKPGRFWGFEGRTDLYIAEIIEFMITGDGHIEVARFMRSLVKSNYRKNGKKFRDRPPAIGCSRSWFGDVDGIKRGLAMVSLRV